MREIESWWYLDSNYSHPVHGFSRSFLYPQRQITIFCLSFEEKNEEATAEECI